MMMTMMMQVAIVTLGCICAVKGQVDPIYEKMLKQYGYMEEKTKGVSKDVPSEMVSVKRRDSALIAYQLYFGLPLTGKLDTATIETMTKPRCGVKDISDDGSRNRYRRIPKPVPYTHLGGKWNNPRITWKINKFTRQLDEGSQTNAFYRAFKLWEDETAVSISQTAPTAKADMEISFEQGDHFDNSPFDGRGHVLAHAFGPGGDGIPGDVHFDDAEQWSINNRPKSGTDLYIAAAHEFGHALGLGHSNSPEALMYPIYQDSDQLKLSYDDIRGMQALYGSRIGGRVNPPTRNPRPRVTARPQPTVPALPRPTETPTSSEKCNVDIDQIVDGVDSKYYVFYNDIVYTLNEGSHQMDMVTDVFELGPSKPDIAFTSPYKDKLYLLKDSSVWRYSTGERPQLDEGFPKTIRTDLFPQRPRFVLSFMDDNRVTRNMMFGSSRWWEFDFDDPPRYIVISDYPIRDHFPGITADVQFVVRESAVENYHFISENRHSMFNTGTRRLVEDTIQDGQSQLLTRVCDLIQNSGDSLNRLPTTLLVISTLLSVTVLHFV